MFSKIKTRSELAALISGTAVELGVAKGEYSEELLENPKVDRLYSIDRWANDGQHNDAEYLSVLRRFEKYDQRSIIIRREFEVAAKFFKPIFDSIYIDGYAHTGQENGNTLDNWWPLLKPGGIFAGHDYHPQYQPTIDAVNRFAYGHGLALQFTDECDPPSWIFPSWYVTKQQI